MSEANNAQEQKAVQRKRHREIDAIRWGVFFIWIGVAVLADLGWGVGLIGIGLIILAGFAARTHLTTRAASGTIQARL